MRFSYNWLQSFFEKKLPHPEKLAELLTMRAFEVESLEKVGGDWALDINIPANRSTDAANHMGLAREIGVITNLKLKNQNLKLQFKIKKLTPEASVKVEIEKAELCPRYSAQILELPSGQRKSAAGVSPQWMQERLITCGMRPVNAVVDVTNYVMLETGQPLHAFDYDKIQGGRMIVREARGGEELVTLDGTKHVLPSGVIIIEDGNRLIDLAGIMGGANSAVSPGTKKIVLQAAVFDAERIYKTARTLKFASEASKLYGGGVASAYSLEACTRAAVLLHEIIGAEHMGFAIDVYPRKEVRRRILFRPEYAHSIIGHSIPSAHYERVFKTLGMMVGKKKSGWIVAVPVNRHDLSLEEDLIEEGVRFFGYENIPAAMPEVALRPAVVNDEIMIESESRKFLVGAGFTESLPYEFTGDKELTAFAVGRDTAFVLENPITPETKFLVPRVVIKYVRQAAENQRHFDRVRLFGIAKSFKEDREIQERKDLILATSDKGVRGEDGLYTLKGVLDQLFESFGISDIWYDDAIELRTKNLELRMFHPYRVAEIKVGGEKIGYIGEIHPEVLKNIKAKARIVAAEINFDKLWRLVRDKNEYQPIGKYPAIVRDVAVVVPWETKTVEIMNVLNRAGGMLLKDADLFDYFQDEALRGEEKKSLAFHLIFQSLDRTLKDEEVDDIIAQITTALKGKKWLVR